MGKLDEPSTASLFERDPSAPLDLWVSEATPPRHWPDLRARALEFTSQGDRVPLRLLLPPDGKGAYPLVLLQHGAGGSKEADYLESTAGPWVRAGAAVASIDFPLHGERASAKLSERLAGGLASKGSLQSGSAAILWVAFVRQAVIDLRRALDALEGLPEIDGSRTTYAAFSLGTILGSVFCANDPRPVAAALAIGGGGFGPESVDPVRHIGRFAPRPVLFLNATQDETIPRSAAEALQEAAGDPKQVVWVDSTHNGLRGAHLKTLWQFLRPHLGLPG